MGSAAQLDVRLTPRAYTSPQGKATIAGAFTLGGIGVSLVLLRCYGASIKIIRLRWDFAFVVIGTALGIATLGVGLPGYHHGLGTHFADLTYPEVFTAVKWLWLSVFVGLTGTWVGKLAIVTMLLQMTTFLQPRRRAFLISVGIINSLFASSEVMLATFQCTPRQYLWDKSLDGSCPLAHTAELCGYIQAGITATTDFALALYPITIVWNLNASLRTKVGFCTLMAGGIICAVAPIERSIATKRMLDDHTDPTWVAMSFSTWANTELWLVLIIASIPPLRPLFVHWFWPNRSAATHRNVEIGTISSPVRKGGIEMGGMAVVVDT